MTTPMVKLLDRIENAKANIEVYNIVSPILATFDGKKITKRINTKVQEVFDNLYNGYTTWYNFQYGMYNLNIRKGKHEMRILLGYEATPIFNFQSWKENNKCFSLDAERLVKYEQAIPKMLEWEKEINNLKMQVKVLKEDIAEYGCEYYFDWDWRYLG